MEYPFPLIFLLLCLLLMIFGGLLRLRRMRESTVRSELPPDKITVLLGMFYVLSRACINYYRDRNAYPLAISGIPEGLTELGYLKDEPLAKLSSTMKLFSIVVTDKAGWGICLAHIKASVAMELVKRVAETNSVISFLDYRGGQYKPIAGVGDTLVNLTLPLPVRPMGSIPPPPDFEENPDADKAEKSTPEGMIVA